MLVDNRSVCKGVWYINTKCWDTRELLCNYRGEVYLWDYYFYNSSYECRKAALLPVSIIKQNNKVLKAVTWKYEENLQCIIRVVFDSPLRCSLC